MTAAGIAIGAAAIALAPEVAVAAVGFGVVEVAGTVAAGQIAADAGTIAIGSLLMAEAEHTNNARGSTWNRHSGAKRSQQRLNEKKRQKGNWKQNPQKRK
jgi:hypothetical protein